VFLDKEPDEAGKKEKQAENHGLRSAAQPQPKG
jgi:hypothetical protein